MTALFHRSIPAALTLAALLAAPLAATDDVFVVNFPDLQRVEGTVRVDGPTPQSLLIRFDEEIVAPVAPTETTALIDGGVLPSAGFTGVVLSLAGQVRSNAFRSGEIGAILIPDEAPMTTALEEAGQLLFALRAAAAAQPGEHYFASESSGLSLAFPRYRVFFYNTTDRPATVSLFAYLTN